MDITYDRHTNRLRVTTTPSEQLPATAHIAEREGILDIGEGGRLIGVEFTADAASLGLWRLDPADSRYVTEDDGPVYIQITAGDTDLVRSTPIRLHVEYDAGDRLIAIAIPRRGHGYEISYPSGNQ